jgi:type IV secretion system protein VirB4
MSLLDLKLRKSAPSLDRIAAREFPESDFIPYACHFDDHTIITKSGDLLQIIKIDGLAFETADEDFLCFRKNLRNTLFRSIAKHRTGLYVHTVRRKQSVYPEGRFHPGFSDRLNSAWKEKHSRLKLFVNDFYLTIIQRPQGSALGGIRNWIHSLSKKKFQSLQSDHLQAAHKELTAISQRFLSNLKDYRPRLLGIIENEQGTFSEPAEFFSLLINLESRRIKAPEMGLDRYLPQKRLLFGKDALEARGALGSKVGAILSIKEYPDASRVGMLDSFLEIPTEFILTQSFLFTDRQAALGKIQTQQRKMIQTEDLAVSQIEQIDEALDDASSGRIGFGMHHLTALVCAEDLKQLDKALSEVEATFLNLGIVAVREDLNLEPCFWAQLPGNFSLIARDAMISTANFAGFASLHNYPCGRLRNNHWGPAVTVLETASGTPYFFNFHRQDVGHTTIIGPTGTGKSVLLNFLLAQSLKFRPKIFFFDKDRGAEIFIRALGGVHSTLGLSRPSGFNPLKLHDSPANRAFLSEWLQILLTSHGETLNAEHAAKIRDVVDGTFKLDFENRILGNVAPFLGIGGPGSLSGRLALWYGQGLRANLFGNREDQLKFDQNLFCFEMADILEDQLGLPAVLAYLFHRINLELNGQPTIIVLEEGWKLLDNPFFAPRIKDWLQTIRKRNGFVIFLTPNIESTVRSGIGDTLVQQSATSIFLPNHKATHEGYCGAFKLSEKEYELVRTLDPQDRCFLIKHGQDSVLAKLDLSGMEDLIPILSGTTKNVSLLDQLIQEHGEEPDFWLPIFQERMKK